MLALPVFTGATLRLREGPLPLHVWWLAACWVAGYLCFHAATILAKSPPARRAAVRPAVFTYAGLTTVFGLATLASGGLAVLGWLVAFAPLVVGALVLAARRRDRSLGSGALTVATASLMTLATRFDGPQQVAAGLGGPAVTTALVATGLVFAYLFGTVLYVKTMIRQRGDARWLAASAGWHAAATLATVPAVVGGTLDWAWPAFFLATLARTLALPAIALRRPVPPMTVGLVEIVFSVAFALLVAVATGPSVQPLSG